MLARYEIPACAGMTLYFVIPAKAGISQWWHVMVARFEIPAFAGMTLYIVIPIR